MGMQLHAQSLSPLFQTSLSTLGVWAQWRHQAFLAHSFSFFTNSWPEGCQEMLKIVSRKKVGLESLGDGAELSSRSNQFASFFMSFSGLFPDHLIMGNGKHGPNLSSFGFPLVSWWLLFCHLGLIYSGEMFAGFVNGCQPLFRMARSFSCFTL